MSGFLIITMFSKININKKTQRITERNGKSISFGFRQT